MSNVSVDNRNGRSDCAQGDWNLVLHVNTTAYAIKGRKN